MSKVLVLFVLANLKQKGQNTDNQFYSHTNPEFPQRKHVSAACSNKTKCDKRQANWKKKRQIKQKCKPVVNDWLHSECDDANHNDLGGREETSNSQTIENEYEKSNDIHRIKVELEYDSNEQVRSLIAKKV